jgi:hypothetical protein
MAFWTCYFLSCAYIEKFNKLIVVMEDIKMFIYILNFLYDGLKKKNNSKERLDFEIIKDTRYILQLAGIQKSFDFINISDRIIDTFEILNKYNLTMQDSIGIINKLINNNNNSWILENFKYANEEAELVLSSIINNAINRTRLRDACLTASCY